jgi:tetratricopeptide (TPR) repeat protein
MIKNGFPQQAEAPTPYHYFLTQLTVLVIYIRLLFIPLSQHLYYLVAVKNNLFDAAVLSSAIFLIIIFAIGIYFYKKNKLISFAIVMFFISQIIESSIFPFKYLLFEYRLYLSTISVGLLISTVLLTYFKKKYAITALSVIAFIYCILTFNQNSIWQNPIKLWTNNVEKSPKNPVANNNLGSEYMMVNDFENAFKFFNKAIELDSNYADPYSQRAVIFSNNKNYSAAIKDAFKAIKLNPKIALFYNNRGYIYQSWGNYDSAIADFKKAIELEPTYHNAMKNISVLLIAKNKLKEAMLFANKSIELDSTKEDYWNNRGNVFFALNDFGNAEKDYQKSVAIKYNYARGLHNIGVLKLKQNQIDDAINYFNLALQQNDKFVDSYFYRGYSFLLKNIAQLAFQDLRQCLLLAPNHEGARQLMNQYFSSPPNNNLR